MKDDETVSSYHAKGCFFKMEISVHWAISIPVAGHWPVYLEWFLALFVASGVPWTTRSCVVKRCRVPSGPGNDLQRFQRWPVHGVEPGWCLMLNFGHRGAEGKKEHDTGSQVVVSIIFLFSPLLEDPI